MISTPIYAELAAELGEPPTGAPVCICEASEEDCSLHPAIAFNLDGNPKLGELLDRHADEMAALDRDQAADEVDAEEAAVGHA